MALLGNRNVLSKMPITFRGGATLAPDRQNFNSSGRMRSRFAGGFQNFTSSPNGYRPPYCWVIATKDGGMGTSAGGLNASCSITASITQGYPIATAISASGTISNAALGLIVSLEAALSASGTITNADLAATLNLVANLSASGTFSNAQLGAIVDMVSSMSAAGTLSATTLVGAYMEWNVGGPTELSPEGLAQALLDDYDIENGFSMKEAIRLILSATAGKVSGADTTTVTIRSVTDGTNRIVATVDTNGNRNSVTYDLGDE